MERAVLVERRHPSRRGANGRVSLRLLGHRRCCRPSFSPLVAELEPVEARGLCLRAHEGHNTWPFLHPAVGIPGAARIGHVHSRAVGLRPPASLAAAISRVGEGLAPLALEWCDAFDVDGGRPWRRARQVGLAAAATAGWPVVRHRRPRRGARRNGGALPRVVGGGSHRILLDLAEQRIEEGIATFVRRARLGLGAADHLAPRPPPRNRFDTRSVAFFFGRGAAGC